jgi:hypothetical protein
MSEYLAFAGNHPFLIGAAVALIVIIIFSEIRRARRPWRDAGPLDAVRIINAGGQVVDVRGPTPGEPDTSSTRATSRPTNWAQKRASSITANRCLCIATAA